MTRHPFPERTPLDQILQDDRVAQGLARLEYLAHDGSIALITGQIGVGKSSLVKLFMRSLSRNLYHPLYLHLTHVTTGGILKLIVMALGELPKRGKERLFLQILEKTQATELTTVIIIDEAHLLEPDSLIDLRLLVSSALDERAALKIILSGQESLIDKLRRATHADLVQRISVRYRVPPLSREQTVAYIDSQLKMAGASEKVFEPEAKTLLHDYARGLPREINNIATACLIHAASRNLQKISETLVNDTMTEIQLP